MRYIPTWYNLETIVATDPPIEASTYEEAVRLAYMKHDGNPPAEKLYLPLESEVRS